MNLKIGDQVSIFGRGDAWREMLLIRAIIFAAIFVASIVVCLSILLSVTIPDYNKLSSWTQTNCSVISSNVGELEGKTRAEFLVYSSEFFLAVFRCKFQLSWKQSQKQE